MKLLDLIPEVQRLLSIDNILVGQLRSLRS